MLKDHFHVGDNIKVKIVGIGDSELYLRCIDGRDGIIDIAGLEDNETVLESFNNYQIDQIFRAVVIQIQIDQDGFFEKYKLSMKSKYLKLKDYWEKLKLEPSFPITGIIGAESDEKYLFTRDDHAKYGNFFPHIIKKEKELEIGAKYKFNLIEFDDINKFVYGKVAPID